MRVNGESHRSIWFDESTARPVIIDQTKLPFAFEKRELTCLEDVAEAIRSMRVRGAPLIGAAAAHGLALALAVDPTDRGLEYASRVLIETRPTAVNLRWAIERLSRVVMPLTPDQRAAAARAEARAICDEDVSICEAIGDQGLSVLHELASAKTTDAPLRILTHCNAGWLATVDWGTALAPIYKAHAAGIPIHVWVGETRPRNQGARLTAFELREQGVPHTVVVDNAGGHLMQQGLVDAVFVGSDRTTASGDVCNKIGTYLKALAAHANDVPFYVALPVSTIDWRIHDGVLEIPIEERGASEVRDMVGLREDGSIALVSLIAESSPIANPAFDVTPARYVTKLITEYGLVDPTRDALAEFRIANKIE